MAATIFFAEQRIASAQANKPGGDDYQSRAAKENPMRIAKLTVPHPKSASDHEANLAASVVVRVGKGDKLAEIELVKRYSKGLLSLLRRKTSDNDLADDLHQDTFRIVLERLRDRGLENPGKLAGFIHATAKNLVIAHYRKQARRKTDTDCKRIDDSCNNEMALSNATLRDEQAGIVRAMLAELPTNRDRELLLRYYLYEEEKQSICSALDLDEKHFDRVIFRARARFKALLIKKNQHEDLRVLH